MTKTELRLADYLPFVGIYDYCKRNWDSISQGGDQLLTKGHLDALPNKTEVKNILERATLLTFYNSVCLDLLGSAIVGIGRTAVNFLEKAVQ